MILLSAFFQNIIGYLKFRKIINPISLFSLIHFFHNWSFSLSRFFDENILWIADLDVSYLSMYEVLNINLLGSWAYFFVIIFFAKTKQFTRLIQIENSEILKYSYYLLTSIYFLRFIINYDINVLYGANQALDSISAFNPISQILFLRVPLILTYFFTKKINRSDLIKIIFIEVFLSFLMFRRKDLVYILSATFIKFLISSKINLRMVFNNIFFVALSFIFLMFVPIYRSLNYIDNLSLKIIETFALIGEYGSTIFFYIINLSNSEGVQNWTYQLIQNNEMNVLLGKSYIQAFINMFILRPFQGDSISGWQAAYYFKSYAYPDVTSTGYDFSFAAEAILNFGQQYAFISFIFLGLIISFFYSNRNKSDFYQTLYMSTWPILIIGFRTDSTSILRVYSYFIFIYLLFYFSEQLKTNKRIN